MTLEYRFSGRDKLVKGYTYPIKRGDLDEALEKAGVTDLEYVSYTCYAGKEKKILVLGSSMTGEAFLPGNWYKMSPSIGIYAVPAGVSQQVKKLLKKHDILNALAKWLIKLEQAENVRRDRRQSFKVFYADSRLRIDFTE